MADKGKGKPVAKKGGPVAPAQVNRIKVVTVGSGGVGKSCLVKRFCEERFVSKYIATIGVDYGVKPVEVDGSTVRVNVGLFLVVFVVLIS
jgi:DnaJ family protein C protein 27